MTTILSYGGGTNSTALLLEWIKRGNKLDAVIFADTGSEQPYTYEFIDDYIKPFCKDHKIPFELVHYKAGPKVGAVQKGDWEEGQRVSIYDWYTYTRSVPSVWKRSCTDNFKIIPIKRIVKDKYPDALELIGIDAGETHRAKQVEDPETGEMIYLYPNKKYPLIDWGIDREQCVKIITDYGWPNPNKSGCYFCPFQSKKSWIELYHKSPDLFNKSLELEINSKKFPEFPLFVRAKPNRLDWLKREIESQTSIFDYMDSCTVPDENDAMPCDCYDGY
jgi:3'-phosphoadenosine 5'-phosphosulfate sulfotransferase (PAPS reductase)/FAD synthetase